MKNAFKIKNAPVVPPGEVSVGVTEEGYVALIADSPHSIYTPTQARNLAKLLNEKADMAERTSILRRTH